MKPIKLLAVALVFGGIALPAMAITLTWTKDGAPQSITVDTNTYPEDLVKIVSEHQSEIESALAQYGVDSSTAQSAVTQANTAYTTYIGKSGISTKTPYTTAVNGLDDFTDVLVDVIPNTQIQQNVWANAYIGQLLPKPHFGFGINAGVSKLDISPLTLTAEALGIGDMGNMDTLVFPTITADFRVGGFLKPFDIGFTVTSLDSSKIGVIKNAIDPVSFDFFTIGADFRYAILKGGALRPKVSVGLSGYYTKGSLDLEDASATAGLDFKTTSLVLNGQASIKLLFFVPFAGARIMFSKSSVDWKVKANWANILDSTDSAIGEALKYGILPSTFSGGSSSSLFGHVRPVIFGGFAFDLAVIDLTFSGSYDFVSGIPSGAFSLRFALN